ncbi:MAG: NUDIX hydrolase [Planctomycetes bacterium]|nr:NUDIX hydrolase [Planctomycetota bacterium]
MSTSNQSQPPTNLLAHQARSDFLGVFALVERAAGILMVQNERIIAGRSMLTWDLPGGGVEAKELLSEALARELLEETNLVIKVAPELLFLQDGSRIFRGRRSHVWRSFFFRAEAVGEAKAGAEILAVRWIPRNELQAVLTAPYHKSFAYWLKHGGNYFAADWCDDN